MRSKKIDCDDQFAKNIMISYQQTNLLGLPLGKGFPTRYLMIL